MLKRIRAAASFGIYMARRLLVDPLVAPARASAFRIRIQNLRTAEDQTAHIPVRSLTDLCPSPGRVVVDIGPFIDGNPTPYELFCLGALIRTSKARRIFEIGTFDGTTTLQLALNSPEDALVYTLDLPVNLVDQTRYPVLPQERGYIMKDISGVRFAGTPAAAKISMLSGDSATFQYEPYVGRMDLVFVDGSHSLPYVRSDSSHAMSLVRPGGWIIWHDYGVWPDVTVGLHELASHLLLTRVEGTTLVVGRARNVSPSNT